VVNLRFFPRRAPSRIKFFIFDDALLTLFVTKLVAIALSDLLKRALRLAARSAATTALGGLG